MRKILFDIGHPAHVHLFKHLINRLITNSNEVIVTARNKDIALQLLEEESIKFKSLGSNNHGLIGKVRSLFEFDFKLYRYCRKEKPDIFISHGTIYAAHIARIMGKDSITLEDTGNKEQSILYRPFTNVILSPNCLKKNFGNKHVKFKGFNELAYLHPNQFTPNPSVLKSLGLTENDRFVLLRFVSRNSSHDIGLKGLTLKDKEKIIDSLKNDYRLYITSEDQLPETLNKYKLSLPYRDIHHLLHFASLLIGESATMASESAILGTPSIYLDKIGRDYTDYQESEYGLVFNFTKNKFNIDSAISKAKEILSQGNNKLFWQLKSEKLINDHIDVTAFLLWFVENYPESHQIMKKDPGYQNNFK